MFTFKEGEWSSYILDEKQSLQLWLTRMITPYIAAVFSGNNKQSIKAHSLKLSSATFRYNRNSKCQLAFSIVPQSWECTKNTFPNWIFEYDLSSYMTDSTQFKAHWLKCLSQYKWSIQNSICFGPTSLLPLLLSLPTIPYDQTGYFLRGFVVQWLVHLVFHLWM